MWTDVVDLRDFYDTPVGRAARRRIRAAVREMWPSTQGEVVLGLGFGVPYLGLFRSEAERTLAFMPAAQGVVHWPQEGGGLTALVDEVTLPLPDQSVDRVLLVHAVEQSEHLRPMMREVWRVLKSSGRVLVVAPNRSGIWARLERTPFGMGHPYSTSQLNRLLRDCLFMPLRGEHALYVLPLRSRMLLGSSYAWERIGRRWFSALAGVVLVEASKEIYAVTPEMAYGRRLRHAAALVNGKGVVPEP